MSPDHQQLEMIVRTMQRQLKLIAQSSAILCNDSSRESSDYASQMARHGFAQIHMLATAGEGLLNQLRYRVRIKKREGSWYVTCPVHESVQAASSWGEAVTLAEEHITRGHKAYV